MQRNLILINLYTLLMGMVFILPVIVPFYRDELGLNFHQFLIGEAVFAVVIILLEVPTGWLADIWGRRMTLLAASTICFLGYLLVFTASGFWSAVVGQAVIGIGVALNSGTPSAMLYDTLLSGGRADEYRKREGLRHGLGLYAVALGSVIGGIAYQSNHNLPFWLELSVLAISLITCLFMREPDRHVRAIEKNPFHDMMETMRYTLRGHKDIGALIVLTALIFSSTKLFLWAQQPYYADLRIPESIYGFLLAGAMLGGGLGGHFGHLFWRSWQGLAVVKGLILVITGISIAAGCALTHAGFGALLLCATIWGFGWPRVQETINHAVGSERRATILSTASLMISLAFIPFSLLLGWIQEIHSITTALLLHGGLIAILGGGFALWMNGKARVKVSDPA
jgi:MFS family permease